MHEMMGRVFVSVILFALLASCARFEPVGAVPQCSEAHGCDLQAAAADGTTLLHIAARAGDVKFVRFLLSQGMGASTPGKYGLPALGGVESEEVAMVLLEAGTDMSRMNASGQSFRAFAEYNHWHRVVEWLTAHHQ
jgi:ankyrin repeat protein